MGILILLAIAALTKWLLICLSLPLLVELLMLTVGSMLPVEPAEGEDFQPVKKLMVLVPSHNEEVNIVRCIQSLEAAAGSASNVLVVAHNCTDDTARLAAAAGARVEVVNDPSRRGKGHALKHGFDYAFSICGADAVMIVDADSTVSSNIMDVVARRLAFAPVVQCRYQVKNFAASWRTTLTSLAFLGINVIRPRGRDRLGLSCGIFGNGFAMRRDVLKRVAYDAHSIVEDMEFHLALVEYGFRVRFIQEAEVLGDMPLSASTAKSQHSRWEGGRIRLLSDWSFPMLRGILQGKLRLVEPLTDLFGLPLALEVFCLLMLLLFPSQISRYYALGGFSIIFLHLSAVIYASPDRKGSLRTLLLAPVYLFWRIAHVTSAVRASSKGAAWVRTSRDVTSSAVAHDILAAKAINSSQESS